MKLKLTNGVLRIVDGGAGGQYSANVRVEIETDMEGYTPSLLVKYLNSSGSIVDAVCPYSDGCYRIPGAAYVTTQTIMLVVRCTKGNEQFNSLPLYVRIVEGANGSATAEISGTTSAGTGVSATMASTLFALLEKCAYISSDVSTEVNAFKTAWGISSSSSGGSSSGGSSDSGSSSGGTDSGGSSSGGSTDSGSDTPSTETGLVYHWDFTQSMTDLVGGKVATAVSGTPSRDSDGLHFTTQSDMIMLDGSNRIDITDKKVVVSFGDVSNTATTRHNRIINLNENISSTNSERGLLWRANSGYQVYNGSWQTPLASLTDISYIKDGTITIEFGETTADFYVNDTLVGEDVVFNFAAGPLKYFTIGAIAYTMTDLVIKSIKVYNL